MTALMPDRSLPDEELLRRSFGAIIAPGCDAERLEPLVRLALEQRTPETAFARQLAAIFASDRLARLKEVAAPTLVVHGTDDPLVPFANGETIAGAIPGARLAPLPGCGHLPMWECPDRLADVVGDFLAGRG
jgi:pimeloyl-ACP methyl ester carboxylesterase